MLGYATLSMELLDEGHFVEQLGQDVRELQTRLLEFLAEHRELAKGAKATLNVQLTMKIEQVRSDRPNGPKDDAISIKSATKLALPARPASVGMAIADTGGGELYVRTTGSDETSPRQGKLTTNDGEITPEALAAPPAPAV